MKLARIPTRYECVSFYYYYFFSRISLICVFHLFLHTTNQTIYIHVVYVRRSYMYKCFLSKHSKKKKSSPNNQTTVLRALREIQEEKKKKTFKHEIFRIQPWRIKVFFIVRLLDVLYYFILLSFHIAIICFKIYIYVFKKNILWTLYFNIKMI